MRLLVLGPHQGWHADQLLRAANTQGHSIEFAEYESLRSSFGHRSWQTLGGAATIEPEKPFPVQSLNADVVLARTMPYGTLDQVTYRLAVLHAWDYSNIPVVNPPRTLETAIDKFATLTHAVKSGWNVPETVICQDRSAAMEAFDRLRGDVVVKPLLGSEGRGVFRINDRQLAWTAFTTLDRIGAVLYVQQFIAPGGRDLRILIWGKHRFGVRRENPADWRTNVSRGATTKIAAIPSELEQLTDRLSESLGLFYGAIDIAEDHEGRPYLLEVNAVPGWKGAEAALNVNLAEILIGEMACLHR